jgi:polysaccharide export outer membrane protein
MRRLTIIVVCSIIWGCSSSPPPPSVSPEVPQSFYKPDQLGDFLKSTSSQVTNEYVVGIGDRLDVVFFFHDDLTTENLLVRTDGRITLPYVGDIMAAGQTPMYLDSTLTVRFSEILRDPNLSVIVREPAEQVVYVLGQVVMPGGYPFETKISLVQALTHARGFDLGAKSQHVVVIRREGVVGIVGVEVDVDAITKGHQFHKDFLLRSGDIVFVPKTRIKSLGEFVEQVDDILRPPLDWLLRGWQIAVLSNDVRFFGIGD